MPYMTEEWYVRKAKDQYYRDCKVEVDDGAIVSVSEDDGAYVEAWVWVANPVQVSEEDLDDVDEEEEDIHAAEAKVDGTEARDMPNR